jgi:hypothetical protein
MDNKTFNELLTVGGVLSGIYGLIYLKGLSGKQRGTANQSSQVPDPVQLNHYDDVADAFPIVSRWRATATEEGLISIYLNNSGIANIAWNGEKRRYEFIEANWLGQWAHMERLVRWVNYRSTYDRLFWNLSGQVVDPNSREQRLKIREILLGKDS